MQKIIQDGNIMGRFDRFFNSPDDAATSKAQLGHAAAAGLPHGGTWEADGVYVLRRRRDFGTTHGREPLIQPEAMTVMKEIGASDRLVFLDLETTGLSRGTGTYAFLCGIGVTSEDGFEVSQFFLDGPSSERAWLDAVDGAIPRSATIVTYNGKTFDIPLLLTRHVLARSRPHWEQSPHIDLLHYSRRFYRGRIESCSLGSMEQHVLGVERAGEDVPGYLIPELYRDFLHTRDASPLSGVFYHNEIDIVSLVSLYIKIASMLSGQTCDGPDLLRAGDIWESLGRSDLSMRSWLDASRSHEAEAEACFRIGMHAKRSMDFRTASEHFRRALDARSKGRPGPSIFYLCEELAKLEEHRFRRISEAERYAGIALAWLKQNRPFLGSSYSAMLRSLKRRCERLARKRRCT